MGKASVSSRRQLIVVVVCDAKVDMALPRTRKTFSIDPGGSTWLLVELSTFGQSGRDKDNCDQSLGFEVQERGGRNG
jgi:hypothetical protein